MKDDLISRKWLVECVEEGWIKFDTEKDKNNFIHLVRDTAPPAQPEIKPPKWVAEDRYVKNRFAEFPHCPQCNAEVTTGQCYCMICGQHIDWSEDDVIPEDFCSHAERRTDGF